MRQSKVKKTVLDTLLFCLSVVMVLSGTPAQADRKAEEDKIAAIVEQECIRLNKDRMKSLLFDRLSREMESGLSPELLKIIQGVVKRTDFDNVSEEKAAEIIPLVHESHKQGAPLEYLDEIFIAAYNRTITVQSLTAAAKALRDFHHSDVPPEIAEEFVYHSLDNGWDAAAVPVLTRGVIYGTDRGLTPQKVALIVMLDMDQGALKKKSADQLVLDAIKLVREREPKKWKPLSFAEKNVLDSREKKKSLESLQKQAEANRRAKEEEKRKAQEELSRLRADEQSRARRLEQERIMKQAEEMMSRYQEEIRKYQSQQQEVDAGLVRYQTALEQEKQKRDQEREAARRGQLSAMQRDIGAQGKGGRLDVLKLYATVDHYIGIPYRWGGDSEAGIDCSAFTRRTYRPQNVELPRTSIEQSSIGFGVTDQMMRPGDLVFFDTSITGRISHVGVYLGDGIFAHASSSKGVTKSKIREKYYMKRFVKAGRVFEF